MNDITVINGNTVKKIISKNRKEIINIVQETYLNHKRNHCINPDSFFLRFPDHNQNRIIGLASSNTVGEHKISGIKWIASYPDNLAQNLPRASASIILNDYQTGVVKAFIEGAAISAARTAASAVLAAKLLTSRKRHSIMFVGCGVISQAILDFMFVSEIEIDNVYLYDIDRKISEHLKEYITYHYAVNATILTTLEEGFDTADIISFATTEIKPYLSHNTINYEQMKEKVILGISLRDFCPDIINDANNILDDIDHCLKADTSVHLAEQHYKSRHFINGDICDLINGNVTLDAKKATIFSPFGMGVLDLNVAKYIYDIVELNRLGVRCSFHL